MMRRIKQILMSTGILFGLILLLSIGILSYLKTDHARRFIQGKINGMIPGAVLCEGLHFSLLKGEFELRRVLLKDPSSNDVAGCDRFFVNFTWSTLFKRELTVETLIIEKPWATIRVDKENEINLMRAFSASKTKGQKPKREKGIGVPFNIVLRSLKLVQGSVHFESAAEDLNAVANNIDLTADGNLLKRSGNLLFCIGKGHLENSGTHTEFDRFRLKATLKDGRIDPIVLCAGTASSELTLSGNIGDVFHKPILDLTLDLSTSLTEMQKAFFFLMIEANVEALALSPKAERAVYNNLIPAIYLRLVSNKAKDGEQRHRLREKFDELLAPLLARDGPFSGLATEDRLLVEKTAKECAQLFQRSNSCVEGRNGQLALRHHSLHRISDRKLAALTTVHNFFVKRDDWTTSAERFFGEPSRDLFEWLLDHLDMPARPAQKRSQPKQKEYLLQAAA